MTRNYQCRAPECDKPSHKDSYCAMHLSRLRVIGSLEYPSPPDDGRIWRAIPGTENHYEASADGLVRRARAGNRTSPWRVLKARLNTGGRYQAILSIRDKSLTRSVHRLVCLAFYGVPAEGMFACHTDGDKTNNRADNLHWGTNSQNQLESIAHGTNAMSNRTHCPRGHEYTHENTYRRPTRTSRVCRTCTRNGFRKQDVEPSA